MLAEEIQDGTGDFCCLPGLTRQDMAEILEVLPSGLSLQTPIAAMGGRHADHPSTLVLVSTAFLQLCGAKKLADLSRLLSGDEDGSLNQFAGLAARLIPDAPASSERLDIRIGQVTRTFTLLCRRASSGGDVPLFAAAVMDVVDRSEETPPHASRAGQMASQGADGRGQVPFETGSSTEAPPSARGDTGSGRESLEAELRRQKAEFRELSAILDIATDGVAVLDAEGRILRLNRSGEALFGYDRHEVAGELFTRLLAPEIRPLAQDYFEGVKSPGAASVLNQGCEVMGRARQGGTIPLFMTLGRIGVPGAGELGEARFCAILRDLTHWKKVERELEEARKEAEKASALKSDFLARVSHEIRTPLNAILGFAEVMMDERFGPIGSQRYKNYLGEIHASSAFVVSLVDDLLDLSTIEAGKMEFAFASIDANRIVAECVSMMQPEASREQVEMWLSLSPALPNILADERSLRQIVLNLLSNAVKFNRPGGQVIAATALADSGSAVIRVRDTGVGMSEGDIGLAFEPFRRLATTSPSRGTGLGLPLTKALVEANHASLTVKSKEHEGTLAEVVFPPVRVLAE
jgi:PAS domain S-box-containing protein